jgi:hypothetical protein
MMLALAVALAAPLSARAQDAWAAIDGAVDAVPPAEPSDEAEQAPLPPLTEEEKAALAATLDTGRGAIAADKAAKLKLYGRSDRGPFDFSGTAKPNAGTVVLKPALPMDWDAKVGADLLMPVDPTPADRTADPLAPARRGSGAAWASVGLPNVASIDARLDPSSEQGKLVTTFKHSIPVGRALSLTLQNSYAVTETYGQPSADAGGLPLMALPADAAGSTPAQVWSTEKLIKVNIGSTGTTLGAGVNSTSTDPVMHNTLSAEQKLSGNFNVTTAVTDIGTAGFKLRW